MTTVEPTVQWSQDQMVEVLLNEPDDFLKVRETLTRIGVASRKEKKLYQSCHILHKQGRYFIVHFKELFALDGKHANLTVNDVQTLRLKGKTKRNRYGLSKRPTWKKAYVRVEQGQEIDFASMS